MVSHEADILSVLFFFYSSAGIPVRPQFLIQDQGKLVSPLSERNLSLTCVAQLRQLARFLISIPLLNYVRIFFLMCVTRPIQLFTCRARFAIFNWSFFRQVRNFLFRKLKFSFVSINNFNLHGSFNFSRFYAEGGESSINCRVIILEVLIVMPTSASDVSSSNSKEGNEKKNTLFLFSAIN